MEGISMKLLFLSDIHGSAYYMSEMMQAIKREKPDQIVLLGDALYHGPRNPLPKDYDPKQVVEMLNSLKNKIIAVRGNCDSEVDQMLIEYPMLADYGVLYIEGKRCFISHGHLFNGGEDLNFQKGDIYIQGHTHIPKLEWREGILKLNPGSVSLPKQNTEHSYAIIEKAKFILKNLDGRVIESIGLDDEQ
jgi:putative phosphoesterase